ncbi:manganese efflux pump MntP family protein [Caldibacillus sp. 210928-DFI.2.22]|uniref:manganese efflux pump MntP n=1 Tax=unclassified Caldibacillus TaxID=2641266 RepID=UPI001D07E7F5|nr:MULTISPECIES: manganese efflux pump MntP family protein [unclassified Caldibacillus]MCB7069039.1 manganese efflux pump MntP family protein [Caldibacillus sp. 210928-DFI.2.22]MCB7072341.1 manganese efflux pump MntP family protein [Caldibacillus sp. 210928-DFI.2.18]
MSTVTGEVFTLSLMAFALGMDAFSVSLGMGMASIRLKQIVKIGLTVGLFHIWMPLIGMLTGNFLSEQFGALATYAGGILLILIGFHMFMSGFKNDEKRSFKPIGIGLFLFAISVSLDSFSLGLTLGIFGAKTITAITLFGFFATILTWAGLLLGRKMKGIIGQYSEAFGGTILLFFGIKLIFPF